MNNNDFNSPIPKEQETHEPLTSECNNYVKAAFGSKLFLAICIITSATLLLSGIQIIYALILVGMWMCYFSARKKTEDPINTGGIKLMQGSLLAQFIINWFAVAFIFAISALLIFIGELAIDPVRAHSLIHPLVDGSSLEDTVNELLTMSDEAAKTVSDFGTFCETLGIIFIIVGIFAIIFNFLHYIKLHSFVKSLTVCAADPAAKPKSAVWCSVWMIIYAILIVPINLVFNALFSIIWSFGDTLEVIEEIADGHIDMFTYMFDSAMVYFAVLAVFTSVFVPLLIAVYIMAHIFINKNFVKPFKNK